MSNDTLFRINRDSVLFETIDYEIVIIEFGSGNYYSLEKTGAQIWNLIDQGFSSGSIIRTLKDYFGSANGIVEKHINGFLAELAQENLIAVFDEDLIEPAASAKDALQLQTADYEKPILQKFTDMSQLIQLDPVHEIDEQGWPVAKN
ncbi:MAG: PqqD family protein [Gammaproteobacteria bacterium]|nr:PqqD family protein [Gammaproteobacteria bacterium]